MQRRKQLQFYLNKVQQTNPKWKAGSRSRHAEGSGDQQTGYRSITRTQKTGDRVKNQNSNNNQRLGKSKYAQRSIISQSSSEWSSFLKSAVWVHVTGNSRVSLELQRLRVYLCAELGVVVCVHRVCKQFILGIGVQRWSRPDTYWHEVEWFC